LSEHMVIVHYKALCIHIYMPQGGGCRGGASTDYVAPSGLFSQEAASGGL